MTETADERPTDRARKRYLRGTHRVRTPAETCEVVEAHAQALGITRVANVTGLDRVGIPVAMAVRPNARSLSVSQGKGIDRDAARASALMESVELWHAENIERPLLRGSVNALRANGRRTVRLDRLPSASVNASLDGELFWVAGRAIDDVNGDDVWLPLECVSADYTLPLLPGSGRFATSSNGLASGNTYHEALTHALAELIERDAESLWRLGGSRALEDTGLDPATVHDPVCQALLEHFQRADVQIAIWDITSDVEVACFCCLAVGPTTDWADPEFGAGCHPDRGVALARALTEAAQARVTFIAGSRDDLGSKLYAPAARAERRTICQRMIERHRADRSFEQVPSRSNDTPSQDVAWLNERLDVLGLERALVVDLSRPQIPVAVVRAVVPGLEGPFGHEHSEYVPGERAQRVLSSLA